MTAPPQQMQSTVLIKNLSAMSRPTEPLLCRPLPWKFFVMIVKRMKMKNKAKKLSSPVLSFWRFSPKVCHYYGKLQAEFDLSLASMTKPLPL
jgi:hypothetical protein